MSGLNKLEDGKLKDVNGGAAFEPGTMKTIRPGSAPGTVVLDPSPKEGLPVLGKAGGIGTTKEGVGSIGTC